VRSSANFSMRKLYTDDGFYTINAREALKDISEF